MAKLLVLENLDQLENLAEAWNALWDASNEPNPLCRAEMLLHGYHSLAQPDSFRALALQQDGRLVAALPLELANIGPVQIARCPRHEWADHGGLLATPDADLNQLAAGLQQLGTPVVRFERVPLDRPEWQRFRQAATQHGFAQSHEYQHSVGMVQIANSWDAYEKSLSKNLRRNLKRAEKKLAAEGEVTFESLRFGPDSSDEWQSLLEVGFQIEDANWKGSDGTSILKTPGMADYFRSLARLLSQAGCLELLFLNVGPDPIAFEFGYTAKGTYFSHKVGYDEQYASASPGQLLMLKQLAAYHQDNEHFALDALSAMSEATAKWANWAEPRYQWWIGTSPLGRTLLSGYRHALPLWRKLRGHQPWTSPTLGTTPSLTTPKPRPQVSPPASPQPADQSLGHELTR